MTDTATSNDRNGMNRTAQRALAWCAVVSMVGFGIGWVGVAGFLPLPAPWHSASEMAGIFLGHSIGIRLGAIFMIIGTMFWVPWAAIVAVQIDDDTRAGRALRYTQICSAAVGTAVVLVAMLMWVVAAFRTDRDPTLIQTLSDLGFVIAIMPFAIFAMWNLALSLVDLLRPEQSARIPTMVGLPGHMAGRALRPRSLPGVLPPRSIRLERSARLLRPRRCLLRLARRHDRAHPALDQPG
jgi:hypothetical protein